MTVVEIGALVLAGAAVGPRVRAVGFRHGVPGAGAVRRRCPRCAVPLLASGWRGLVDVLGWTGRCPLCRFRIGPPAGSVELAGAGSFVLLGLGGGPLPVLAGCWLVAAALALVVVDAAAHRLPDALTLPTLAGTLGLLAPAVDPERAVRAVAAALVLGAAYGLSAIASRGGVGAGDVKLAPALGAALGWVGWPAVALGTLVGFALAAGCGLALVLGGRAGRRHELPFGPYMLAGALVVLLG